MTAPQTNEELRQEIKHKLYGVILDIQSDYQQFFENKKNVFLQSYWENKLMEVIEPYLIPQPEQLEVKIKQTTLGVHVYEAVYYGRVVMKIFETKQEALDFCKRFNLKVVNESDKDGLK